MSLDLRLHFREQWQYFDLTDLQEHMPEVVRKGDDILETLSVNYMDTIAVLAADNQQQEERIEALEKENIETDTKNGIFNSGWSGNN